MGELLIAVAAGIGATITPCVLPLYPSFLAYLTAGAGRWSEIPPPVPTGCAAVR